MITIECSTRRLTIEMPEPLGMEVPAVFRFMVSCLDLHRAVPLVEVRCRLVGGVYRYTFEAADGRKWRQDLTIQPGQEVGQTFSVSDIWLESEFALHRQVRAMAIELVQKYGATDIRLVWL